MIQKIRQHTGKLNLVGYTALIIFGINYFTEHGKLQSDVQWCDANVSELTARANKYEDKYEACVSP